MAESTLLLIRAVAAVHAAGAAGDSPLYRIGGDALDAGLALACAAELGLVTAGPLPEVTAAGRRFVLDALGPAGLALAAEIAARPPVAGAAGTEPRQEDAA